MLTHPDATDQNRHHWVGLEIAPDAGGSILDGMRTHRASGSMSQNRYVVIRRNVLFVAMFVQIVPIAKKVVAKTRIFM